MALKQYSFLGNGRETNNVKTSVTRQQILDEQRLHSNESTHKNRGTVGNGVFNGGPCRRVIGERK
jgi:hypothetical protein